MKVRYFAAIVAIFGFQLATNTTYAVECNPIISKIIQNQISQTINNTDCPFSIDHTIGICPHCGKIRIAIDKPHHSIIRICYKFNDEYSWIESEFHLKCKTSDDALVKTEVNENIDLDIKVRNSDCKIVDHKAGASGLVGGGIIKLVDLFNMIRPGLRKSIDGQCK